MWSILAIFSGQPDHSRRFGQSYAALHGGKRAASCRHNPSVGVLWRDQGPWGLQPS